MAKPVTWDQLIDGRPGPGQASSPPRASAAESLTVWLNALIESAGGHIIEKTADSPEDIELGLDVRRRQGGRRGHAARSRNRGAGRRPALSTADEDATLTDFEGDDGSLHGQLAVRLAARASPRVEAGTLDQSVPDDYGWALYPPVDADEPAAPPYGGINLGIGAFSKHVDLAYAGRGVHRQRRRTRPTTSRPTATRRRPTRRSTTTPTCSKAFPHGAGHPRVAGAWPRRGRRPRTTARSPAASSASTTRRPSVDPETTPQAGRPT